MGLRSWLHGRRRTRQTDHELREFAYLDDISLYSLYASIKGFIPTELRQSATTSRRRGASFGAGLNPGAGHASAGGRVETESSNATELLGKAVVQGTFKELYDLVGSNLVLGPPEGPTPPPPAPATVRANLSAVSPSDAIHRFGVSADSLHRGGLVELDVQLEAEPIFRTGTVVAALLDLVRESPAAFGISTTVDLRQAGLMNQILDKLLGGLVPVRGRVVDYRVAEVEGKDHIVPRHVLDQLGPSSGLRVRPLVLTGVAEPALFWKAPQLVLFADLRYRVFARLLHDGIQCDWSPIKLADVLRRVAPEAAAGLDQLTDRIGESTSSHASRDSRKLELDALRQVVVYYATQLSTRLGSSIEVGDLESTLVPSRLEQISFRSVPEIRAAFAPITQILESRLGHPIDHALAAEYRAAALEAGGFTLDGQWLGKEHTAGEAPSDEGSAESFLDSEIIAIYW
jgi:hypothetical protein